MLREMLGIYGVHAFKGSVKRDEIASIQINSERKLVFSLRGGGGGAVGWNRDISVMSPLHYY